MCVYERERGTARWPDGDSDLWEAGPVTETEKRRNIEGGKER